MRLICSVEVREWGKIYIIWNNNETFDDYYENKDRKKCGGVRICKEEENIIREEKCDM